MQANAGRQIGNYQLLHLLGRGGFANVYLGEHIYLKTQAAIKILQMQLGDEDREQFINEARTIAHLVHPRIIRVLDFGVQDYMPYLVMDYAPNGTLRQRHALGTRLPLSTIVSYVKQVASALQYAHDQHFIHRDIKPGNMLIGRNDEILLSDFGTALLAHSTASQDTADTVGTVAYMAPEQISGKPRPASDQYALGIVVYEWLSGEHPFRGSLQEIIAQQMATSPPPLHARFPDISPDVEEAVMMALAKDPYQRFDNVEAFAHALEEAERTQNAPARVLFPAPSRSVAPPPPFPLTEKAVPTNLSQVQVPANRQAPQQMTTEAYAPPRVSRQPREEQQRDGLKPGEQAGRGAAMSPARQLFTMLAGIIFYGILYYFIVHLSLQNKAFASEALFGLSIVVPMFFGAAFGPAVGLVTAIGGYLIGHSFLGASQYWNNALGTGLIGLITGFAILKTHGRYRRPKALATAVLFAVLGILIGEGFADCTSMWVISGTTIRDASLNFLLYAMFEGISAIILLPVLLGIYALFSRNGKRA